MGFMIPFANELSETEARQFTGDPEATSGWYSQLSAPGYMDQTDWMGPFDTPEEALKEVMDFYEVDYKGDYNGEV